MVYIDQTDQLRSLISQQASTASSSASSSGHRNRQRKQLPPQSPQDAEFLKQAYVIHHHLADLGRMLKRIRKPYLSTEHPPPLSRRPRQQAPGAEGDDELKHLETSKYLTDKERDEIDVRAKMVIRRCRDSVALLEESEKARQAKVLPPASKLFKYLPSLAPATDEDSDGAVLTAHRASVLWTLNNMLAKLTATQAELQEERAKRRKERTRTLGGGAAREAAALGAQGGGTTLSSLTSSSNHNTSMSGQAKSWQLTSTPGQGQEGLPALNIIPEGDRIEETLTPAQLQQFETENNALLEHMESQLSAVLAAERSLLEISAMQTELIRHLAQQTEITDRLYDEAVGSVAEIGKAKVQLVKAKERSGEARLFLLVFLLGASFALLFLDWYS